MFGLGFGGGSGAFGAVAAGVDAAGVAGEHVVFFQGQPNATAEFAHGAILLGGAGFEDDGKDLLRAFDGVYAKDLGSAMKTLLNSSLLRMSMAMDVSMATTLSGLAEKSTLTLMVATE